MNKRFCCQKSIKLFSVLFLLFNWFALPAYADAIDETTNTWHYFIAPYGWLTSLDGDVTAGGIKTDFNVPFSQIWQNLSFVGEIHGEANYGPWSIMLDPTYLKEAAETDIGNVHADLTSQTLLVDGGLFYQVFSSDIGDQQSASLEFFGGGRWMELKNDMDFTPNTTLQNKIIFIQTVTGRLIGLGSGLSVSSQTSVIAPILGARIKYNFSSNLHYWLRGDVGGFDIDHVENTWSGSTGFDYDITPNFDIGVGYRVLRMNVVESNTSVTNLLIYGPLVGVSFSF